MTGRRDFLTSAILGGGWITLTGAAAITPGRNVAAEATIHRHHNPAVGLLNAYLIETPESLVAVDAGFLLDDVEALLGMVADLGKALRYVLLTHPHPDHYNGASILARETGATVACTVEVIRTIRREDGREEARYAQGFGARYPRDRALPEVKLVAQGVVLDVDGVRIHVEDLGPGESLSDTLYWLESGGDRHVFPGDTVMGGTHAFFRDGHSGLWLASLERMDEVLAPRTIIYPGHGDPGGPELVTAQSAYIQAFRESVRRNTPGGGPPDAEAVAAVQRELFQIHPADRLGFLIPLGVDVVAAELRLEAARDAITEKLTGS